MKRICPFCKSNLHSNSVYFCAYCGNLLPGTLQLKDISFKKSERVIIKKSKRVSKIQDILLKKISKYATPKHFLMGILFLILVGLGFFLLVKISNSNVSKMLKDGQIVETTENVSSVVVSKENMPVEKNIVKINIDAKSGLFGQRNIYEYVPYDVDFYAEFNDSNTLASYFSFMGGEFFTLTEKLDGNIDSSYSAFFIEKEGRRGWVFIVFPLDETLDYGMYNGLVVSSVDKALVISLHARLINEVVTSKSGVTKNLSLNPAFITLKSSIPVEGKAFILSLTEGGNTVLGELSRSTSSDDLKDIVNNFKKDKFNYLVVQ